MDVLVAGAGSIGTVIGLKLGCDMLRRSGTHLRIHMTGVEKMEREVQILGYDDISHRYDIVLVTSQSQHTGDVGRSLLSTPAVGEDTMIVSLQNGVGNGDVLRRLFRSSPVVEGAVWWSATLLSPDHVYYHRQADTVLGGEGANIVAKLLQDFRARVVDDISLELYRKLLLNVVSPVLALVKQPYPEGLAFFEVRKLISAMYFEGKAVLENAGYSMEDPRLRGFEQVLKRGAEPGASLHKVSTQIGIEKYGGSGSNVEVLLGPFVELGASGVIPKILDYVKKIPADYKALRPSDLLQFLD